MAQKTSATLSDTQTVALIVYIRDQPDIRLDIRG